MKSLRDENQNAFHRNTNFPYKIRSPTTKASKISMFPTLLEQCFPNYRLQSINANDQLFLIQRNRKERQQKKQNRKR